MISNCGHDENGKYSKGKAGDQTGKEYQIRSWYSRPWDVCLRCTDPNVRKLITQLATDAANNNMIGYDQGDRYTFWEKLKACGYYPKLITEPCEADCSSSTLSIVKAAGYLLDIQELKKVSIYGYTGNIEETLLKTGYFKSLRDKKYLESEDYILASDILLCTGHHVCINITDGGRVDMDGWYESRIVVGQKGMLITAEELNLRMGPGVVYNKIGSVKRGDRLFPSGKAYYQSELWFHCGAGWISGRYVESWIQEENGKWWYITEGAKYPRSEIKEIDGAYYAFDKAGWMITADRIAPDGRIL